MFGLTKTQDNQKDAISISIMMTFSVPDPFELEGR